MSYEIIGTEKSEVVWSTRTTVPVPPPPTLWDEEYGQFLFGITSDWHFGSKWAQITNLRHCVGDYGYPDTVAFHDTHDTHTPHAHRNWGSWSDAHSNEFLSAPDRNGHRPPDYCDGHDNSATVRYSLAISRAHLKRRRLRRQKPRPERQLRAATGRLSRLDSRPRPCAAGSIL